MDETGTISNFQKAHPFLASSTTFLGYCGVGPSTSRLCIPVVSGPIYILCIKQQSFNARGMLDMLVGKPAVLLFAFYMIHCRIVKEL